MKKRIWYIAVLALLVAVLLIACGKKEAETQGGGEQGTSETMEQQPESTVTTDTGDTVVDTMMQGSDSTKDMESGE